MSVGLALALDLAFVCTLVSFVGHAASRINVDTITDFVARELSAAIARRTTPEPAPATAAPQLGTGVVTVTDDRRG